VIRIERCNFSTREIATLLRNESIRITEFINSPQPLLVPQPLKLRAFYCAHDSHGNTPQRH
jgi:hypothetical protein